MGGGPWTVLGYGLQLAIILPTGHSPQVPRVGVGVGMQDCAVGGSALGQWLQQVPRAAVSHCRCRRQGADVAAIAAGAIPLLTVRLPVIAGRPSTVSA